MRSPVLLLTAAVVSCPVTALAAVSDTNWTETIATVNRNTPTDTSGKQHTGLAWAPDGSDRLFVLEKTGRVRIAKGLSTTGTATWSTFATMSPIYTSSECGLIGMAFDPAFAVNHLVYFFVTINNSTQQIIRYDATTDTGASRTVIMPSLPTAGANHDGGGIEFGPDGKLYWSIGDLGGGTGVDADLTSLASKVGRANIDGTVPNDNPFFDGAGPNNDYIFARGFRNPFTMTFQPSTGALWLNVVGTLYEQIFIVKAGEHGGWNDYENNQPAGFITPVVKYRTNGTDSPTLSTATRTAGVTTFTTTSTHRFRLGERIAITGLEASFNTNVYVASTPTATTFTAAQAGANATSTPAATARATTLNLGGSLTGGTFFDVAGAPAAYAGNFFFGDYNSGVITRVTLDATTNVVNTVDPWGSSINGLVDMAVGPDGALYYTGVATNNIYRAAYTFAAQAIIVDRKNVWMNEGSSAVVSVRLARAPAGTVTVSLARSAGDADVTVSSGGTLTFTTTNWSTPQSVTISAASDADSTDDTATVTASAPSITSSSVDVRVREDNSNGIVVSTTTVGMVEGATGSFTVALARAPAAALTVNVARSAGDSDVTVSAGATLSFSTTDWATPKTVTLTAASDADMTNDTATITASATGLASRSVAVTVTDDDVSGAPTIVSTPVTTAVVGAPYAYKVVATGTAPIAYSLTGTVPTGMTIGGATGDIAWTPAATGMFPVNARATNAAGTANQPFTITVNADMTPTCALTRPTAGETVSGTTAEFFGDGFDDVAIARGEFAVDGVLGFTDTTAGGHLHFGATHNLWDTTKYANGAHTVRLTVFDTSGKSCFKEAAVTVSNGGDATPDTAPDTAPDTGLPADTAVVDGDAAVDDTNTIDDTAVTDDTGAIDDAGVTDAADSSDDADPGVTPSEDSAGCGCRTHGSSSSGAGALFALALLFLRRRAQVTKACPTRSGAALRSHPSRCGSRAS